MSELRNPHDRFFKDVFGRAEAATDFLTNYLPTNIVGILDLTAVELVKDSFVGPELQEYFSDLLYRVQMKAGQEALD